MGSDGFLRRWARLKSGGGIQPLPSAAAPAGEDANPDGDTDLAFAMAGKPSSISAATGAGGLPSLDDAARLTPASDYSAFIAQGVDQAVRRLAMKKLFSDPHFNLMDGLDIYIGDYNRADPVPASMLAALRQAQGFLQQMDESEGDESEGNGADTGKENGKEVPRAADGGSPHPSGDRA